MIDDAEDIDLNLKLNPVSEVDSLFESTLPTVNTSDDIVSQAFTEVEIDDEFGAIVGKRNQPTAIFEAAKVASEKEEKNSIPSYARGYLKTAPKAKATSSKTNSLYERAVKTTRGSIFEADEEDEDIDVAEEEDNEDVGIDFGDLDVGGEDDDQMGDFEEDDEDFDDDEYEDDEESFEDPEDIARTESIQDEDLMDDELASIMGSGEDTHNIGLGQGQHKLRPYNSQGIRDTAAFSNTVEPDNSFDDRLQNGDAFSSGGFLETFDDGLLFVDRKGQSLALAIPDTEEDINDGDLGPTDSLGIILVKGEDGQESVIEISGEELDSLITSLMAFKSTERGIGFQSPMGNVYEKAKKLRRGKR